MPPAGLAGARPCARTPRPRFRGGRVWAPGPRPRRPRRGAVGDPRPWTELTGIVPRPLSAALASRPASVQERWFAGLYLLKPAVFIVLSLFWIATGALSLGPAYWAGLQLVEQAGAGSLGGLLVP